MSLSRKLAKLILSGRVTLDQVVTVLAKYHMLALVPSIKKALTQLGGTVGKEDVIRIESPFALSDDSIKKIKRIVGNDIAHHEVVINKTILAGFQARFRGKLYDGSAERIIRQLIGNH